MSIDIGAIEAYLHWQSLRSMSEVDTSPTAYYEHIENLKNAHIVSEITDMDIGEQLRWSGIQTSIQVAYENLRETLERVYELISGEETHDAGTAG